MVSGMHNDFVFVICQVSSAHEEVNFIKCT
jgi:hypothetical protein